MEVLVFYNAENLSGLSAPSCLKAFFRRTVVPSSPLSWPIGRGFGKAKGAVFGTVSLPSFLGVPTRGDVTVAHCPMTIRQEPVCEIALCFLRPWCAAVCECHNEHIALRTRLCSWRALHGLFLRMVICVICLPRCPWLADGLSVSFSRSLSLSHLVMS